MTRGSGEEGGELSGEGGSGVSETSAGSGRGSWEAFEADAGGVSSGVVIPSVTRVGCRLRSAWIVPVIVNLPEGANIGVRGAGENPGRAGLEPGWRAASSARYVGDVDPSRKPESAAERSLSTLYAPGLAAPRAGVERELPGEEIAHLKALRLREGDEIAVTDGRGLRWRARLSLLGRREARCRLEGPLPPPGRWPIDLWIPVANRDRSLWLVEKAVELGARSLAWVEWGRSRSVADAGRSRGFMDRAERRAVAALKQCGGAWLPELSGPVELEDALPAWRAARDRVWLADVEGEPARGAAADLPPEGLGIVVGPEGGVSPGERERCREAGLRLVSLGPRTLRFETAALAALAIAAAALDEDGDREGAVGPTSTEEGEGT